MKLLVVTTLAEYDAKVTEMLTQAGIKVFSKTETTGFKAAHQKNIIDNWYGGSENQYDSIFFFSFTDKDKAENMLKAINKRNSEKDKLFPVRGFIMPVESSTVLNNEI